MIAPMSKVTVVVLDSSRERELANLKRLGLLHPEIEQRKDERTDDLEEQLDVVQRAQGILANVQDAEEDQPDSAPDDPLAFARHVQATADHIDGRREVLDRIQEQISRLAPWGAFDPAELSGLADRGIDLRFYSMNAKEYRKRAPAAAIELNRTSSLARFAVGWHEGSNPTGITPEELEQDPGIDRFVPGELSLTALRSRLSEEQAEIERAQAELRTLTPGAAALGEEHARIAADLEDARVRLGMDTAERVAHISGFVPAGQLDALKQSAANNGWGLLIREPEETDVVPTKIENRGPVKLIRPVFDFLGVVPGYHERDISFFFLLFFIVFVGMIIGDAGYGALLLLASVVMLFRSEQKLFPSLLLVLGLSTLAWGAMTGNWFGYEPIGEIFPLSALVVPSLDTFETENAANVQQVAFALAVIHLTLAHIWNFFGELRQKPRVKALAQLGWLSMVVGLYLLVLNLFIGLAFPDYGVYLIGGGLGLVVLFGSHTKESGFFGGIGRGFANLFTTLIDSIGGFSDVVSYIRLFAVGLATVQIAQAFNSMAAGVGDGIVGIIGASVILALGHSLNVVMAGLAVIVHGVRLNLLEFSGHLGMEWTGIKYEPYS